MTTTTFDDMSTSRIVGRVRLAAEDFCRLYIELRNGQVVTVDGTTPFDFTVGSVVLVTPEWESYRVGTARAMARRILGRGRPPETSGRNDSGFQRKMEDVADCQWSRLQ